MAREALLASRRRANVHMLKWNRATAKDPFEEEYLRKTVECHVASRQGLEVLVSVVPGMMYGFGDAAKPRQETVDLVEDMVIEYVSALLERAVDMATFRGKLKYEDFVWQVSDEPYKLERLKELLEKNEEIKKARKVDLDKSDLAALGSREKDAQETLQHGKI